MSTSGLIFLVLFSKAMGMNDPMVNNNDRNFTRIVHELEQKVDFLSSRSQVSEQKYAAVLSSVLSKLTSTTDELTGFKAQIISTTDELTGVKAQLKSNKDELLAVRAEMKSNTDELAAVKSQLNSTLKQLSSNQDELTAVKVQLNSSLIQLTGVTNQLMEVKAGGNSSLNCEKVQTGGSCPSLVTDVRKHEVAFEVIQQGKIINRGGKLHFNRIVVNRGFGYLRTHVFRAPVNGIYLFWFNIPFTEDTIRITDVIVKLEVNNKAIASFVTPVNKFNPPSFPLHGVANGIYPFFINKGDVVTFWISDFQGSVRDSSGYGGVLLRSHDD